MIDYYSGKPIHSPAELIQMEMNELRDDLLALNFDRY